MHEELLSYLRELDAGLTHVTMWSILAVLGEDRRDFTLPKQDVSFDFTPDLVRSEIRFAINSLAHEGEATRARLLSQALDCARDCDIRTWVKRHLKGVS